MGRLIVLAVPGPERERFLGDLDEEYHDRQLTRLGRWRAGLWYVGQCLRSIGPLRTAARRRLERDAAGFGTGGSEGPGAWVRDVRHALRGLARNPAYTVVAVGTLGLGIGATTAIYSVVEAVLLEPLPYSEPDRIFRAWKHLNDGTLPDFSFRVIDYEEAARSELFEAAGGEFVVSQPVVIPGVDPEQVDGRMITGDFFDVFGVSAAQGRLFSPQEIAAGDATVLVVSHTFWERMFGADPGALGSTIDLGGTSFEVVGVLPADYVHVSGSPDVFVPFSLGTSGWIGHWLDLYVRAVPGLSEARVAEELDAVIARAAEAAGRSNNWHTTAEPLHTMVVGDVRTAVWAVFGTVVLVLLIASLNVANLGLARAARREAEFAVRRALGAGRGRLVRQLLAEQLTIAALGGVLGLGIAVLGVRGLVLIAPTELPRMVEAGVDPSVLAWSAGVTLGVGFLFGLVPAVFGTRAMPVGRATRRGWVLRVLVSGQVALALTLLVGSVLLVKTVQAVLDEDLGFERNGALAFRVTASSARHPSGADVLAFFDALRRRLGELPGVTAVGVVDQLPLGGEGAVSQVNSEERARLGLPGVTTLQRRAGAGVFSALGTGVVDGREFDDGLDRTDTDRVAIISRSLAELFFPGESAVGRRVTFGEGPPENEADWMTVVGVVEDLRFRSAEELRDPQIYQAHTQSTPREMALVVRTSGDPTTLVGPARDVLRSLDPSAPLFGLTTLDGVVDAALARRSFTRTLFAAFAGLALVLTLAGVYGVLSFVVQQRLREVGVRMALGAGRTRVVLGVVGRGMAMGGFGVAIGLMASVAAYTGLESLFFGVRPLDLPSYALGAGLMLAVVWLGAWVPARRASAVDPSTVLREE